MIYRQTKAAVIGAGHAGIEAALACARMGIETVLFTMNLDAVGNMPCNPSIGGTGKGHLVFEIDALGGEMGRAADRVTLQSRTLNTGKGPAVRSKRIQADRMLYRSLMKKTIEETPNLSLVQAEIVGIKVTGEGAERFVDAAGVQLDHHPDETKSRGQYLPLLELAVREDPQNDRNCHYLGREYMFRGEWQKAIETLARHLTLPSAVWADERCASMRYIARCLRALEQDDSAERWLHRAIAEAPHLREPYMDYAQLLYTQERWYGLVDVLRAALAITERPRTYICEADAWGSLPYDLLSLAYAHLGDAENAADACRNAVERSPQEERLRKNLALFEQMRER